jgi:hypothetical protein
VLYIMSWATSKINIRLNNEVIGPSEVHALPLGVEAERSVHYNWDYFSSSFFPCHILFSQKGLS